MMSEGEQEEAQKKEDRAKGAKLAQELHRALQDFHPDEADGFIAELADLALTQHTGTLMRKLLAISVAASDAVFALQSNRTGVKTRG